MAVAPDALLVAAILWGAVGSLLLISLPIMESPGPATISLVAAGSVKPAPCSPNPLGVIVGTTTVLVAVATGVTAALLAVPAVGSRPDLISAAVLRRADQP